MRWMVPVIAVLGSTACGTTDWDDWSTYGGETPLTHEAGQCRAATALGECNVIEQCGCPTDESCVWSVADGDDVLLETCTAAAGSLDAGQSCDPDGGLRSCRPETVCVDTGAGYTCHEWCRATTDCSIPDLSCDHEVTLALDTSLTFPYMVCSRP